MSAQFTPVWKPALLGLDLAGSPRPPSTHSADPSDWQRWRADWHRSLNLSPLEGPTGLCIPLEEISDPALLDTIIDAASGGDGTCASLEDAGIALLIDGQLVAQPNCCVDLAESNASWSDFVGRQPSAWQMIWNGHPWVMGRVVGRRAEFSVQSEEPKPHPVASTIADTLPIELSRSHEVLADLADRLTTRLAAHGDNDPVGNAHLIVGIEPPSRS